MTRWRRKSQRESGRDTAYADLATGGDGGEPIASTDSLGGSSARSPASLTWLVCYFATPHLGGRELCSIWPAALVL